MPNTYVVYAFLNIAIFFQILKKHEYFGKYGKIHKVVINQSTSYAGSQVMVHSVLLKTKKLYN